MYSVLGQNIEPISGDKLYHQWAQVWNNQRAKNVMEAENTNLLSPNAQNATESSINTGHCIKECVDKQRQIETPCYAANSLFYLLVEIVIDPISSKDREPHSREGKPVLLYLKYVWCKLMDKYLQILYWNRDQWDLN